MPSPQNLVLLFDIDNTLLDNDTVQKQLFEHLENEFGVEARQRYIEIFEELRTELGYADYLGALQRYRLQKMQDPRVLKMSSFLIDYPFADRLYPGALDVLAHCRQFGQTAILSDGDVVFQPRKVMRSGIWDAVDGRVLIYIHKEQELANVAREYPADHYVLVDDKIRILTTVKRVWQEKVTTVFIRQGHYAFDTKEVAKYPPADLTIEQISDLLQYQDAERLISAAKPA
jgi:FMN phosphatase YigB (HAD superfamily)